MELITEALKAVDSIATLVEKLIDDQKQAGNLTAAQEQAIRDRMKAAFAGPNWQPDQP